MRNKYDGIYLSLLAVLGLESGCARNVEPQGSAEETASGSASESGEGTPDLPDEPPGPFSCENPYVVTQAGGTVPSGFENCNNGFNHRVEAVDCVMPQPDHHGYCLVSGDGDGDGDGDGGDLTTCAGDCEGVPYGSCQPVNLDDGTACHCESGCASDADCEAGYACVCSGVFSALTQCVPADCLTDDDCGDGLCGLSHYLDGCSQPYYSLHCAGPLDDCHTDADCGMGLCPSSPDNPPIDYECGWQSGEGFTCDAPGDCYTACGRPFFVDDRARLARASTRGDWSCDARPAPVDPSTAAQLAAYWTEIGLFEHASVASFARVCLDLMRLGAPPSLLLATRAALGDEIEHARLSFGLASAYAGREIGPGPIDVAGSLDGRRELHAIVEDLVREACVEETLAAIEAGEAASQAEDACVAAILGQIASDELRHALLGWRTLQWILQTYPTVRSFALDRLATAIANARQAAFAPMDATSSALRCHGVLDDVLRLRVRRAALAAVLEPAVLELTRSVRLRGPLNNHQATRSRC
jgi:hypothetical protein